MQSGVHASFLRQLSPAPDVVSTINLFSGTLLRDLPCRDIYVSRAYNCESLDGLKAYKCFSPDCSEFGPRSLAATCSTAMKVSST